MIKSTEAVKAQVAMSWLKLKEPKLNYLQSSTKKSNQYKDPEMQPLCKTQVRNMIDKIKILKKNDEEEAETNKFVHNLYLRVAFIAVFIYFCAFSVILLSENAFADRKFVDLNNLPPLYSTIHNTTTQQEQGKIIKTEDDQEFQNKLVNPIRQKAQEILDQTFTAQTNNNLTKVDKVEVVQSENQTTSQSAQDISLIIQDTQNLEQLNKKSDEKEINGLKVIDQEKNNKTSESKI
ncbi:UNKNOWN [Stylonychia lemnae]|uniref:Transmembrane protein n=1 Tax=Stylonychia lemnae TaxID=5949 RepID=A0A078AJB5_STYLE|nr:UNKNOWN [Stylonychia lemnae]|eukprot:CDW82400.1 UNKNOWN [Stylonychia lemnae]